MAFDPYLHFQGNCTEAMQWYAGLFGGELFIMRFNEAPDMPPEMAGSDKVMHAALKVNGRMLMASDYPPGMAGEPQNAVSISHSAPSFADGKLLFDKLVDGGTVDMAYEQTFWADGFGMLRDKFGTHWMVSGPDKPM